MRVVVSPEWWWVVATLCMVVVVVYGIHETRARRYGDALKVYGPLSGLHTTGREGGSRGPLGRWSQSTGKINESSRGMKGKKEGREWKLCGRDYYK